jgi:hypothetical protein
MELLELTLVDLKKVSLVKNGNMPMAHLVPSDQLSLYQETQIAQENLPSLEASLQHQIMTVMRVWKCSKVLNQLI